MEKDITGALDAALRKAVAVWVATPAHPPRLVWGVWRDHALLIATGQEEQEIPGLADNVPVTVTVRSPTTHSHLLTFPAKAAEVPNPTEETIAALASARLNRPPRWTKIHRLTPA